MPDTFKQMESDVLARIFWLHTDDLLQGAFPTLDKISGSIRPVEGEIIRVFSENVRSVVVTASVPYRMVFVSVYSRRHQAFVTAEKIRRLPLRPRELLTENDLVAAAASAREQLELMLSTVEGQTALRREMIGELADHLRSAHFRSAAEELLRQCTASLWTAAETLISDLFRTRFAARPRGIKAALLELLATVQPPREVMETLGIWLLYQQRHLFVHRAGIVDRTFIRQTGLAIAEGSRLTVTPAELSSTLRAVVALAERFASRL